MTKTKAYIAIDLKSFYASVECKERNRDPLTTNLVVADQSRTEKTICLAVSPSLKSYGIPGRPHFICYMIERVARRIHQKNSYVVNTIGKKQLEHLISVANVLHSENPKSVEDDWIEEYQLEEGDVDVIDVDKDLVDRIPTALQMEKAMGRFVSAVAYTLWSVLLAYNDVSKVAIFGFVNPLCSVILSALVLGEVRQAFNIGSLIALALVCVGIYVVNAKNIKH